MSTKEKVCFPSENKRGACSGVFTEDPSKSILGLVLVQEWWGMNAIIVQEAADISERGNLVTVGLFCRMQGAGCRLKFNYNLKTAGT